MLHLFWPFPKLTSTMTLLKGIRQKCLPAALSPRTWSVATSAHRLLRTFSIGHVVDLVPLTALFGLGCNQVYFWCSLCENSVPPMTRSRLLHSSASPPLPLSRRSCRCQLSAFRSPRSYWHAVLPQTSAAGSCFRCILKKSVISYSQPVSMYQSLCLACKLRLSVRTSLGGNS